MIGLLDENNLAWHASEVSVTGQHFVSALTDTLWYIDGHHAVLSGRSCNISVVFAGYTGYNIPEVSKHRKRVSGNMSADTLRILSNRLFNCLQATYWDRPRWKDFHKDVEMLARSLASYIEYLNEKNKQMKLVHASPVPIQDIGEGLQFSFLPISKVKLAQFAVLEQELLSKEAMYESVCLTDYCPQEPWKKYDFLRKLKSTGLPFPCALLTYSHKNNVGNLHFVWEVPDTQESYLCSESVSN